ncbi:uncharacterized protein LOC133790860 [Humulus lupulus]|uniref:uncharacterized protein LOC133790860 n=1 Tax=Humulus lupulus TaxID=3486 RepID=UPI002B40F70A|nr:uncharacterized protein LOC133790860 [Humulus lupulus]
MKFLTFSLFFSLITTTLPPSYLYLYSLSFLFLLSLNNFFPIMITFCRKSVHSFLGLTTSPPPHDHHDHHEICDDDNTNHATNNLIVSPFTTPSQTPGGLGTLVTAADDDDTIRRRQTNVLESTATNSFKASSSSHGRGIGFIDDIGGGVNGLMSCTESLGFESSDERRVEEDDHVMDNVDEELTLTSRPWSTSTKAKCRGRRSGRVRHLHQPHEVKKYPPPLSSLNQNGQPSFYLRAVRKDGRLELTEVRIHRPEILRAYREDGRLRLQFIKEEDDDDEEDEEEEEECIDQKEEEKEKEVVPEEVISELKEEEEGGDDDREMKVPVSGGEGLRRCHDEVVNNHNHHQYHQHQHQHHLHVWRQTHCVTTR